MTAKDREPGAELDQVRVVRDVGARGAEMNHAAGRRCRVGERVHVRHHVVAETLLVRGHGLEIDVVQVGPHVIDRGLRHVGAQGALGFGEGEPHPPPEPVPRLGRPQRRHLRRRVAFSQRRGVARVTLRRYRAVGRRAHCMLKSVV